MVIEVNRYVRFYGLSFLYGRVVLEMCRRLVLGLEFSLCVFWYDDLREIVLIESIVVAFSLFAKE